jgi:hypothetical protein
MFEKLYVFLLKLYPEHFRRAYGDEALRLVRDRARDEKGFISGVRLGLDLVVDLAKSLPREYGEASAGPIAAVQTVNGDPSFQLLDERSLSPVLLVLAGTVAAGLFWACVSSVAHSRVYPDLFQDRLSLQWLVQGDMALARSRPQEESAVCMTANRDISMNSVQPLLTLQFAAPGASGVARIDGKVVKVFRDEQHLTIHAAVAAGDHQFALHLDGPAENTSMSSSDDFKYCAPK